MRTPYFIQSTTLIQGIDKPNPVWIRELKTAAQWVALQVRKFEKTNLKYDDLFRYLNKDCYKRKVFP